MDLKELFENHKQQYLLKKRYYSKRQSESPIKAKAFKAIYINAYEPSKINSVYESSYWRWQRVIEWDNYVNNPYEDINGHILT